MALLLCMLRGSGMAAELRGTELRGRVVDSGGAGVANAVVFVEALPTGVAVPAGPRTAVMDQVNKQFVPHVLPVVVGTEVRFPNHDQIHHHVYSFSRTKTFEIPLYKGEAAAPVVFDKVGAVKLGCNIHDWMSAVILVLPTPFFAMTDANGEFVLHGLPAGRSTVAAWHEGSKATAEETARAVDVGADVVELDFVLPVSPPRARPALRGLRGYE
jgi:plastocyanin